MPTTPTVPLFAQQINENKKIKYPRYLKVRFDIRSDQASHAKLTALKWYGNFIATLCSNKVCGAASTIEVRVTNTCLIRYARRKIGTGVPLALWTQTVLSFFLTIVEKTNDNFAGEWLPLVKAVSLGPKISAFAAPGK